MTALTHAWACLVCEADGTDPGADLAARKHGEQTGHATTVHVVGGPYDTARVERKP